MVAVDRFVGDGGEDIDREGSGVSAAKSMKQAPVQKEATYRQYVSCRVVPNEAPRY